MTGYRVAVGEPELSPLAVSEELAATQRRKQILTMHFIGVIVTVGLWLPGLFVAFLMAQSWATAAVKGYTVRIAEGQLFVGTRERNSMFPLERIQSLSTADGVLTVVLQGQAQGIRIEGLIDPLAASSAILRARDEKTRVANPSAAQTAPHEVEASRDARGRSGA